MPAQSNNFARSGILLNVLLGPIVSPNPGPTFPIAEAAPDTEVMKSSPKLPNKQDIIAKASIYKKKKPITDSATVSGIGFLL